MDDPAGIASNSASVACLNPRKLIVTTNSGSPIPDETPATLNNASTCPPTAATARSIEAGSVMSTV